MAHSKDVLENVTSGGVIGVDCTGGVSFFTGKLWPAREGDKFGGVGGVDGVEGVDGVGCVDGVEGVDGVGCVDGVVWRRLCRGVGGVFAMFASVNVTKANVNA
jgi:hypothetical protein